MLNNHLEDILESIALAKLKIISKHILHPQEINYIHEKLQQQNVDIKVDENLYEFLELDAYFNHSNIIFIVHIPIFNPETFSFYRLKQLPLNNSHTLKLESQFLLLNKYIHQFVDKPCQKIEQIRYCHKTMLLKNNHEGCITNLINNQKAHCHIIEEIIQDTVELIERNYLFVSTQTETSMETTCNKYRQNKILKGTSLLYFENCTIKINNIEYSSKLATFWDTVVIISTLYNEINTTLTTPTLSLETLNQWTTKNTEAIHILRLKHSTNHISILGIFLVLVFCIIGILLLTRCIRKQPTSPEPEPAPVSQPIQLHWPSLHS